MSVGTMSLVFKYDMPNLKTDDGKTVPDSTAKFVLLALADHCNDEGEGAYPGVKKICKKTSMSTQTVCNALNALRHNGYTTLEGKSKADTNNYTINLEKLGFQRLESDDSSDENRTTPAARVKPSVKPSVKPQGVSLSIENAIATNQTVTNEMLQKATIQEIAPRQFENALGFSKPLPWWTGKDWVAFSEWVCQKYEESKTIFAEYNIWRNTPYTKGGMSNNRIRGFVKEFYDSWDMFMMSRKSNPVTPIKPITEQPDQDWRNGLVLS